MAGTRNKFKFSTNRLNLNKAENEDYFEFEGLASTDDPDLEDEIIKQNFDLSAIVANKGYVNDDHGHSYDNKDDARLGVIDKAEIRPEGLWVKGKVWKSHPAATSYYNEMKYKPGMVQLSVEGYTIKRNPFQSHVVEKAVALGVALTRNPVNNHTFAQLAKSLSASSKHVDVIEKNIQSPLIHSFSITSDPSTPSVVVTQTIDPTHPHWDAYQDQMMDLAKGGMGSGKHDTGLGALREEEKKMNAMKEIHKKPEKIVVMPAAPKEEEPEAPKKNPQEEQQRRRQELQAERTAAIEGETTKEGKKTALARIQKKTEKKQTRKRVRKSVLQAELLRRSQKDPLFKSKLQKILSKALASGGPAYATTLPGDFEGGQVFQQESLNSHAQSKKCKKCKGKGKNCKC